MSEANSNLSVERCREVFDYDPETGHLIIRLRTSQSRQVGDIAGWISNKGYVKVKLDSSTYAAHRLIWFRTHGQWPTGVIDHINGIRHDNRLVNLRDVTGFTNAQNMKSSPVTNQTSGLLGAYPSGDRWKSKIVAMGKMYHLGSFRTAEEAHQCYLGAKRLLHPGNTL